jgi:hypothetical protein
MIVVAQDAEGLRQAAAELLEDALEAPQREKNLQLAERAADPELILRASRSRRTLSPGYYMWLDFVVVAIEQPLEAGIAFNESRLDADELLGLQVVRHAREEFRRNHPPCRGCGVPLRNAWDQMCNDCQKAAAAKARKSA